MSEAPIAVLLPYRDAAATLAEALESVVAQRGCDLEVLAINDGSTDGSDTVARSVRSGRIRHLDAGGRGLVAALELGRASTTAPWIGRMDADDVCRPERFARQLAAFVHQPKRAVVGCRVRAFGDDLGAGMRRYVAWQNSLLSPAEHRRDLFVEAPLCHPSTLLRAEALDAVGGWRDPDWAEDYDLWLRLDAAGYELAKVSDVLLDWRHRAGRATFSDPRYRPAAFRRARAHFLAPRLLELGRPVAVWGAGRTGTRLARELEAHGVHAREFVDIDRSKVGRTRRGAPVVSPEALVRGERTLVVAVGAAGARETVRGRLVTCGFQEGTDFICAA